MKNYTDATKSLYILTKLSKYCEGYYNISDKKLAFEFIDHQLYVTASNGYSALRVRLDDKRLAEHIENILRDTDTYSVTLTLNNRYYVTNKNHKRKLKSYENVFSACERELPNITKLMTSSVKEPIENIDIDLALVNIISNLIKHIKGSRKIYTKFNFQGKYKPVILDINLNDSNEFAVILPLKL